MDRAVELEYIGGMYGHHQPTEFLCLTLKLLQLLPEKDIITVLIQQEDYK
jgi:pre-mRNA-splicing factor 38A